MDPGIRIRIKNVTNPEHWGKLQRKTVWKDNGERQKGKKKMKTRGKEKRRQWEDTWENNRLKRGRERRVRLVTFSL
jgi:hypothetical protein